nr:MAG TPA: hypothetical protein [Caudoviricetes sp.]
MPQQGLLKRPKMYTFRQFLEPILGLFSTFLGNNLSLFSIIFSIKNVPRTAPNRSLFRSNFEQNRQIPEPNRHRNRQILAIEK